MKFKVGDKVKFKTEYHNMAKNYNFTPTKEYEVLSVGYEAVSLKNDRGVSYVFNDFKVMPAEPKQTKNERIKSLEKQIITLFSRVDELEVKYRDLRNDYHYDLDQAEKRIKSLEFVLAEKSKITQPSTIDEIIEFEGQQYRKVDREAREGDVVIPRSTTSSYVTNNKSYKVVDEDEIIDNDGYETFVYSNPSNRTPETVDVYEPIQQEKSPNQLRAEIIEKAKRFVEGHQGDYKFHIQDNLTVAFNAKFDGYKNGYACCNPSDVFNEHIGKAIALGRALNLDVTEFEQAVQPTGPVVGQVYNYKFLEVDELHEITRVDKDYVGFKYGDYNHEHQYDRFTTNNTIDGETITLNLINDTNAIYGN